MTGVTCRAGHTQLAKVLRHVAKEHEKAPVAAVILVGDCCEEPLPEVGQAAVNLGKIPVYAFLEGDTPEGKAAFELIAEVTKGVVIPFDANSPNQLRELLGAVALLVVGGVEALADQRPEVVHLLTHGQDR